MTDSPGVQGCRRCQALGFIASTLAHGALVFGIWWSMAHLPPLPGVEGERSMGLTLAMFATAEAGESGDDGSAPDTPPTPERSAPPTSTTQTSIDAPSPPLEPAPPPSVATEPPSPAPAPTALAAVAKPPAPKREQAPERPRPRSTPTRPKPASAQPKPKRPATVARPPEPDPEPAVAAPAQDPPRLARQTPRSKRPATPTKGTTARAKAGQSATATIGRPGKTTASAGAPGKPGSGTKKAGSGGSKRAAETRYLSELQRAIAGRRYYPPAAKRDGLQGTARVQFTIQANGRFSAIRVSGGSGSAALDQAALTTVKRLGRFKPIPATVGRSQWTVRVPIDYRLR